jgi:hypothetical protein
MESCDRKKIKFSQILLIQDLNSIYKNSLIQLVMLADFNKKFKDVILVENN